MSATPRARSGVPLDLRSALPTVPGIPAWGAVAVAAGLTFVGFAFAAASGSELTSVFSALYFLGCLLAVLAVRHRGLFTAVVQPPLVLFVAVPIAQQLLADNPGTGLKDLALNVAYPLVNRFPLMLAATVVVALVAGARVFLTQQGQAAPTRSRPRRSDARPTRTPAAAERRGRSGRAAQSRASRATHEQAEPVSTHAPRGYRDSAPREPIRHDAPYREPVRREPVRREPPRREPVYGEPIARDRQPIPRDPIPVRTRPPAPAAPSAEVPPHPVPRVRYRDRREPPVDR
ncbi:DUF6542 domain-containing protein [Rhodococcus sp. SGAir0479]|uniref:DUF6542 domain-containing protein n=1 Tax=Rhodococcus sp. SGAir0479 TaxID=2567884 RepID=UPI0010CCD9C1|nr:DUF6542 domain-containing protein [Rhodococcus sp. SGAir0479]QCQ90198.1 hypothetical protein E7742_02520 [Rhodococcus sp. SGAir0479]